MNVIIRVPHIDTVTITDVTDVRIKDNGTMFYCGISPNTYLVGIAPLNALVEMTKNPRQNPAIIKRTA